MNNQLDDYVQECMADTQVDATVEQFERAFCDRCLNPDCKRSSFQGLKWSRRMKRQLEGLNDPTFMSPDNPLFAELSTQDFLSFEEGTVRVQGWDSFTDQTLARVEPARETRAPAYEQETPVRKGPARKGKVHQGKVETQVRPADQLDASLKRLGKGTPEPEPERAEGPEPVTPEPSSPEPEPQEARTQEARTQEARTQEARAPRRVGPIQYNTPAPPKGGIMLPGAPPKADSRPHSQGITVVEHDPWAVDSPSSDAPSKSSNTLVVRLSSSEKDGSGEKGA